MSRTFRRKNGYFLNVEEKEDVLKNNRYHSDAFDAKCGGTSSTVKERANTVRRNIKKEEIHKNSKGSDLKYLSSEVDVKKLSNKRYIYS